MPVQFGGGVRTMEVLERAMKAGIGRLVVGTSALLDEDFLARALELWGDRLVVAVDAEDGYVKTHGWRERSGMTAPVFVRTLEQIGVAEILYTDIGRDGMMQGVNLAASATWPGRRPWASSPRVASPRSTTCGCSSASKPMA